MDTEDQPATESANGGAADIKTAETGTKAATKKSETFTVLQMIKSTDLRKPLLIACALQAVQQFSGINAVSSGFTFVISSLQSVAELCRMPSHLLCY